MKTQGRIKIAGMIMALGLFSLLLPASSQAICLQNCQSGETTQRGTIQASGISTNSHQSQADKRLKSHNFGDNSTNVMGDSYIHIGHENVVIKGIENSTNSMIDMSINAPVILGNMNQ